MNDSTKKELIIDIQKKIEASSTFKFWSNEVGISFEDFDILDLKNNLFIKKGKKSIGNYYILVKEDNSLTAGYDLTVEVRKNRLQRIEEGVSTSNTKLT